MENDAGGERSRRGPLACLLAPLLTVAFGASCAGPGIAVSATGFSVEAPDGLYLNAYELRARGVRVEDRGLLFYVQGSGHASVLDIVARLAGAPTLGLPVFVMQKPGITEAGIVDEALLHARSSLEARTRDHLAVLREVCRRHPIDAPVIVVGGSEGGLVAAEMAAREPRISHLVLVSSGGGWTQERELRHLLSMHGEAAGARSLDELDGWLDRIRRAPDSDRIWAGHAFRRWSSFLWATIRPDRLPVGLPVLLVHGGADRSVPVESARALRDAFVAAGRTELTYVEYPAADHALSDADGRSLFPLLEIDLARWMAATGILSPRLAERAVRRVRANHSELFEKG